VGLKANGGYIGAGCSFSTELIEYKRDGVVVKLT
jgi:hypothetical protein